MLFKLVLFKLIFLINLLNLSVYFLDLLLILILIFLFFFLKILFNFEFVVVSSFLYCLEFSL